MVPYCYLFLLSVFILWFSYYVSDILKLILGSWMTTYLGKSCLFSLPWVPFVNCRRFMYLVISFLVYRAGCGIWFYQFLIIGFLFTLFSCGVTIEPCLEFYAVPSLSQCMTLRSRSQILIFLCVKSLQCQLLQSLWLIWIVFGMNGYKILKCFRKEKRQVLLNNLPFRWKCFMHPTEMQGPLVRSVNEFTNSISMY